MKTYSKTYSTSTSCSNQCDLFDKLIQTEKKVKSGHPSGIVPETLGTKMHKQRIASPFVKNVGRKKKASISVGRYPSKRPIKSPRLEPPRYVNALLPSPQVASKKDGSDTEESDFTSQETIPGTPFLMNHIRNIDCCPDIEHARKETYRAQVKGLCDLPKIHEDESLIEVEEEDKLPPAVHHRPELLSPERSPQISPPVSPEALMSPDVSPICKNSTLLHKNAIPIQRFLPPRDISAIAEIPPSPMQIQKAQENTPAVKTNTATIPKRPTKSKRSIPLTNCDPHQPVKSSTMYDVQAHSPDFEQVLCDSTIAKVSGAPNGETVSCMELSENNTSHPPQALQKKPPTAVQNQQVSTKQALQKKPPTAVQNEQVSTKQALQKKPPTAVQNQQIKNIFYDKFSSTPNNSCGEEDIFNVELSSVHEALSEGELYVEHSRFVNSEEILSFYYQSGELDQTKENLKTACNESGCKKQNISKSTTCKTKKQIPLQNSINLSKNSTVSQAKDTQVSIPNNRNGSILKKTNQSLPNVTLSVSTQLTDSVAKNTTVQKVKWLNTKNATITSASNTKNSTISEAAGTKNATISPASNTKSATISPASNTKNATISPATKTKNATISPALNTKNATISSATSIKRSVLKNTKVSPSLFHSVGNILSSSHLSLTVCKKNRVRRTSGKRRECIMRGAHEDIMTECCIMTAPDTCPLRPAVIKQRVLSARKMKRYLRKLQPIPTDVLMSDD